MAYNLHIELPGEDAASDPRPIKLTDWKAAVESTDGVRCCVAEAHSITNPKTGEIIRIPQHEGDAEVFFPEDGLWRPVFRWQGGSAAFVARLAPGDFSHPVWKAAAALATHLGAVIRGDDGESYDLRTGGIIGD